MVLRCNIHSHSFKNKQKTFSSISTKSLESLDSREEHFPYFLQRVEAAGPLWFVVTSSKPTERIAKTLLESDIHTHFFFILQDPSDFTGWLQVATQDNLSFKSQPTIKAKSILEHIFLCHVIRYIHRFWGLKLVHFFILDITLATIANFQFYIVWELGKFSLMALYAPFLKIFSKTKIIPHLSVYILLSRYFKLFSSRGNLSICSFAFEL